MLGVEAIPALVYTLLVIKVPKSPSWLIAKRDDFKEAERILRMTDPERCG
jgi:MFS transporter, SP family, arabinose:H+ symporter